jgi:hypothetical protein
MIVDMTDPELDDAVRRRPDGPPAGVLGVIALALAIASVIAYVADSGLWTGFFAFAASAPLGIYAATVYARLLRLGIRVPGPNIAFLGGITASILLATSGLTTWAQSGVEPLLPPSVSDFVSRLVFALGGIGFAGGLGLLLAGIAVPSVILLLVPRWLGWTGLILAAIGEIAFLSLLWDGLDVLLPITRFGGLVWLTAVGFLLPRNRHDVPRRTRPPTPAAQQS